MAVVTQDRELFETQRAFDRVAAVYDQANRENAILCAMRRRARAALEQYAPPGARVLDLGCGPGTDEVAMAAHGYDVTAIDWSPAMVAEARRRVQAAGVSNRVRVEHLGIHELDRLAPERFDAAYSNFGPLNCVPDPAAAAHAIASRLRSGGALVATVIGRWCPWEFALFALQGSWARATVRLAHRPVPVPLEGGRVWTRYYTPREFIRIFARAGFSSVYVRTLSLFAPPPYLDAFAARHPLLTSRVRQLDDAIGAWPVARSLGDHFLVVLRRT